MVLLLLSGLLIGRSGLGLVEPLDLGQGLQTIVGLLVSLVLFDGGLNLRLPGDTIKATVLRISVLRIFISLGAGILAAHWLAGLSWSLAAVFSAIVLATGPTVVTPIVKQIRLAASPWRCAGSGRTAARAHRRCVGTAASGTSAGRPTRLA